MKNILKSISFPIFAFTSSCLPAWGDARLLLEQGDVNPIPLGGATINTNNVRSASTYQGDFIYGYGAPALNVVKWNGGDPFGFSLGGTFSSFTVDGDWIYATTQTGAITSLKRTKLEGDTTTTETLLEDVGSLTKREGLASGLFATAANGKVAFNIQQGPPEGVDYFAQVYFDGTDFTYIAESGDPVPDSDLTMDQLTGFTLSISPDGSKVAFIYDFLQTSPEFIQYNALLEWDGSTLHNRADSDDQVNGSPIFPQGTYYLGADLYFTASGGAPGLFKVESTGGFTLVQANATAINGTEYNFTGEVVSSGDRLLLLGRSDGAFNFDYAGFIYSADGSFTLAWESKNFPFIDGQLRNAGLRGFDGEYSHLYVQTPENRFIIATTLEVEGGASVSFWEGIDPIDGLSVKETGFGRMDDSAWPWIHHADLGTWLWIDDSGSADGFYAHDVAVDTWIWSADDLGGWYYDLNAGTWGEAK